MVSGESRTGLPDHKVDFTNVLPYFSYFMGVFRGSQEVSNKIANIFRHFIGKAERSFYLLSSLCANKRPVSALVSVSDRLF